MQTGGMDLIQLNYRDAKPICEQIEDGMCRLILSHSLGAGERIPSVREMASRLAINPNTIKKAYQKLEAEGYIYTVEGEGTFVAAVDKADEQTKKIRNEDLMDRFDEIVEELLYLSVDKRNLKQRIEQLAEGGAEE